MATDEKLISTFNHHGTHETPPWLIQSKMYLTWKTNALLSHMKREPSPMDFWSSFWHWRRPFNPPKIPTLHKQNYTSPEGKGWMSEDIILCFQQWKGNCFTKTETRVDKWQNKHKYTCCPWGHTFSGVYWKETFMVSWGNTLQPQIKGCLEPTFTLWKEPQSGDRQQAVPFQEDCCRYPDMQVLPVQYPENSPHSPPTQTSC